MNGLIICLEITVVLLLIVLFILFTILFRRWRAQRNKLTNQAELMGKLHIESLKERVAKENAARCAKSNQDFLFTVFYEIQSQLECIGNYLKQLTSDVIPDKRKWLLLCNTMKTKQEQLLSMINGTLEVVTFEKKTAIEKNDVIQINSFCQAVFDGCMDRLADGVDASFETSLPDEFTARTNMIALEKVLTNLILSSMDYTRKGSIQLSVSKDAYKNRLVFKINDTGKGIPDDIKEKVFEILPKDNITNKIVGIRLRICRALIKLLNGIIYFDPHYTGGTSLVFTVQL